MDSEDLISHEKTKENNALCIEIKEMRIRCHPADTMKGNAIDSGKAAPVWYLISL